MHPVRSDGAEQILLDRNKLANGQKFADILPSVVSENHKLMAYMFDFVGDENYKLALEKLDDGRSPQARKTTVYLPSVVAGGAPDPPGAPTLLLN